MGKVCRDGATCFGESACDHANITIVVNGFIGIDSCWHVGTFGGSINEVYNSCFGQYACAEAAFGAADMPVGGLIGLHKIKILTIHLEICKL